VLTRWLTNTEGGTSVGIKAAWSPDSKRIAYIEGYGTPRLHALRLSDRRDEVIGHGRAPSWSPDSRRVAFLSHDRALAIVGAGGGPVKILDANAHDPYFFGAAWSPGGRWVAYRRDVSGDQLWLFRPTGKERRRLTSGVREQEIGPIYWAPDGETILYTHLISDD
jgi:Tol biopolymer transport system component